MTKREKYLNVKEDQEVGRGLMFPTYFTKHTVLHVSTDIRLTISPVAVSSLASPLIVSACTIQTVDWAEFCQFIIV